MSWPEWYLSPTLSTHNHTSSPKSMLYNILYTRMCFPLGLWKNLLEVRALMTCPEARNKSTGRSQAIQPRRPRRLTAKFTPVTHKLPWQQATPTSPPVTALCSLYVLNCSYVLFPMPVGIVVAECQWLAGGRRGGWCWLHCYRSPWL